MSALSYPLAVLVGAYILYCKARGLRQMTLKPEEFPPLFLHPSEAERNGFRDGDMWGSFIIRIIRPIPKIVNRLGKVALDSWRESRHPLRP